MAISKLLVASFVIVIVIVTVGVRSGDTINCEIDELRWKVLALESRIEDKIIEIRTKEDIIVRLDTIIREKLASIGSLEIDIKSLQKKGAVDAKNLDARIDAWVRQIEKMIVKLRNEIEADSQKKDALSVQASEAEKKVHELNLKLETVLGAWLPPWLATRISHIQDLAVINWNEHAKPVMIHILHKASGKLGQVQEWVEYLFAYARTEWIPVAKEQLLIFKSNVVPCLHKMTTKTFVVYEASKSTIAPHIVKLQEVAHPCFQEAKEFSRPYFNQIIRVTWPYVEKFRVLMPHINHVARPCYQFLSAARTYHSKVQENMYEKLKMHKLTKPYATKELAWVLASVLLTFPVFFMYRALAAVFCKSAKTSRRRAQTSHTYRRPKRKYIGS